MDFIKTSEAYGYETIAEAEEKAIAAKYEEGRSEGREEGIGIGLERGDLNARWRIAKKLKLAGSPLSFIAEVSDLSKEEIQNL